MAGGEQGGSGSMQLIPGFGRAAVRPPPSTATARTATASGHAHLTAFSGFLHADTYAGYGRALPVIGPARPRVRHVACFAHARRKFFEVWEAAKLPIAEEAVRRIAQFYGIEAEIVGRAADVRLAARSTHSA